MIRTAIRNGVSAGIEVGRLPLRAVGPVLPAQLRGVVELGADHAQATTELAAGRLLGDAELTERGRLRRAAVRQRTEAVRLWGEAGERRRLADLKLAEDRSRAEQQRVAAKEQEDADRQAVAEARAAGRQQVADTTRERKAAVRTATAKKKSVVQARANERRLEVLDAEEQALDVSDDAVTAADEAARLKAAAAKTKQRRKTG
ncbi:MAG: hypothetical protein M3Z03_07240 [Actinomycetota bacterium]|nr:hypothetical protein [Actinomycetota bacterium]